MSLPGLRPDQHAQILGFSIIGFGFSILINLVSPLLRYLALWNSTQEASSRILGETHPATKIISEFPTDFALPYILYGIAMFGICGLAGLTIRSGFPDPKGFGLLFVILSFGTFPLGTLVSLYALVYIFVIYDSESENSASTIKLN
ncbi:MAG TPA: hypothetical protein VMZ26_14000 [Pyrinomonadaceae bacterium]|nr:hypothetical protein [Pyrinomonadaceae bacterium]